MISAATATAAVAVDAATAAAVDIAPAAAAAAVAVFATTPPLNTTGRPLDRNTNPTRAQLHTAVLF